MDSRAYKRFRFPGEDSRGRLSILSHELRTLKLREGVDFRLELASFGGVATLEFYDPGAIVSDLTRKQALDGALYQARAVPE